MSTQYLGNLPFDITRSLKDYEYTKRAVVNLNRVIESSQFKEKDSEAIFQFLQEEMEVVSFGDYLKRYLYENSGQTLPFAQVPEEYYVSILRESFRMNQAPHAFSPVKTRWSAIVKRWLENDSAERDTVFLLGFGLRMTDQEVSSFLTKVLKEQDFRFDDPRETAFWHCYHQGLPYSSALSLLRIFEQSGTESRSAAGADGGENGKLTEDFGSGEGSSICSSAFWCSARSALKLYLSNRHMIRAYMVYLKTGREDLREKTFLEFQTLFDRAVCAARKELGKDQKTDGREESLTGAFDVESVLCSGMPRTASSNLAPVSRSILCRQFEKKRMSRQHLSRLLNRRTEVERFDIITLLFLVYAAEVEPGWPAERLNLYIDEANEILERCHMMGMYPVHPYESFIMMCLLTEEPLAVYNDVWEMSYA